MELDKLEDNQLNFEGFMQLLKQTAALVGHSEREPNYLLNKNMLGENINDRKKSEQGSLTRLPSINNEGF
jgi:hypothetical protein